MLGLYCPFRYCVISNSKFFHEFYVVKELDFTCRREKLSVSSVEPVVESNQPLPNDESLLGYPLFRMIVFVFLPTRIEGGW